MGVISYLLDTHTFLQAVQKDVNLSGPARLVIEDADVPLFVSAASAYEIMNKYRLGKLPGYTYVGKNYIEILRNLDAKELSISTKHAHFAGEFDWAHRDPFDRFLAAQASLENMILITDDSAFNSLPYKHYLQNNKPRKEFI